MAKNNIEVKILGDAKGLNEAVDDADGKLSKLGGGIASLAGSIAKAGAAAAVGIGAGLAFSIGQASDLNESLNAVSVTFGDAAAGIMQLGEDAATAVGLSNTEFNGLAVQFSSFAKTIAGPGGDVVSTMDEMTTRAADFASVMNVEVADAAAMFQSGLAGETEPLKKYGLDLSAAAVETYALANGIIKSGEEMTEAQKVQARYGALMEQTATTAGDFTNTSDGLANQQRILKAEFKNIAAAVGSALLPIMAKLATFVGEKVVPILAEYLPKALDLAMRAIGFLVDWVKAHWPQIREVIMTVVEAVVGFIQKHWPTVQKIFEKVFDAITKAIGWVIDNVVPKLVDGFKKLRDDIIPGLVDAFHEIIDFLDDNHEVLIGIATAVGVGLVAAFIAWAAATWAAVSAQLALAAAFIAANAPMVALAVAIGALVAGVIYAYNHFESFRAIVDAVVAWLRDEAWPAIQAVAQGIADAFGAMVGWVQAHWDQIMAVIDAAITVVKTIIETQVAVIVKIWETFGDSILSYFEGIWEFIKTAVQAAIDIVRGIIQTVTALIHGDWSGAWDGIKLIVSGAWDLIKGYVQLGIDTVKSILTGAWEGIKLAASTIFDGILGLADTAWQGIVDGVTALPGLLLEGVQALADAGLALGGAIMDGISDAFGSLLGGATDVAKKFANTIIGFVNSNIIGKINGLLEIHINVPMGPDIDIDPPNIPNIPTFHTGGVVPGREGADVPIMARAGEMVLTESQQARLLGMTGGGGINIGVLQTSRPGETVEELRRMQWLEEAA